MIAELVPPQSLDYERSVLGSMLVSYDALDVGIEMLDEGDFYRQAHSLVYQAIAALWNRSEPVDPTTIADELMRRQELDRAGGIATLAELMESAPTTTNIRHHCQKLREVARLRQLIRVCDDVKAACYDPEADSGELVNRAEAKLFGLASGQIGPRLERLGTIATRTMAEIRASCESKRPMGISTGLTDVDEITTGLHRGDLIYVAGRPGMGKTAFLLHLAQAAATCADPVAVAIYSLEMSRGQLAQRGMCRDGAVPMIGIRGGKVSPGDLNKLDMAARNYDSVPIWIDDTPGMTVPQIRSSARRLKARDGLGLIMVDYLQLMKSVGRVASRREAVEEISHSLKALAKELDVSVVALSQLSRLVEQRGKNKRPALSDLKESGAAEEDADLVMLLYRDEYYNARSKDKGIAEIIVAKQRNGPTGTTRVHFDKRYMTFMDLSPEHEYENTASGRDGADW